MKTTAIPTPRSELSSHEVDDDLMIYDPMTGRGHFLNQTAAHIWRLLDGQLTVASLARTFAEAYGLPYRAALTDVRATLEGFDQAGLLAPADETLGQAKGRGAVDRTD
jgi:PqqD family protein of HPr-rel-A system